MNLGKLILNYLLSLIWRWYSGVIAALDLVGLVIIFTKNLSIPPWVYFTIIGLEFLVAGFLVYYADQVKFQKLKEETQKEIVSLRSRILELEDRIPRLGLSFKVGDAYVQKQTITVGEKPTKPDIDKLAREEQGRLSDYDSKIPENKEFSHNPDKREMEMAQLWMNMPKKLEDYKEECRGYINAYKYYLNKKYNYELGQARYRTVQFVVEVTGKTPGQEIVLVVHFPDGFYFYDDDNDAENRLVYDFHIQPEKPTPPKVTESLTEKMQKLSSLSDIMYSPSVVRDTGPQHVRGPFITRIKSTEISYEIDEILHNFKWEREISFFVMDEVIGKTREITYKIHAANLQVPISGSLWIEVVEE